MRRVRLPALLLPLVVVATGGCGIRETEVVEVGDPATVEVAPGREQGTLLYFVSPPPAKRLMPVVRPVDLTVHDRPDSTGAVRAWRGSDKAIVMLLDGPDKTETAAGLRTELPHADAMSSPSPRLTLGPDGVLVRLGTPVEELSDIARQQLICTAAQALTSGRAVAVRVSGTDGTIGPDHCSL
ncbi:hypothetical protein ACFYXM_29950 [Streptomyces sp. NPDC002476]|uniref:hypothetical protein n=1 Tax=Streptomyces sp. NPDC002476 TaxID=3364648 RepID=UPI0036C9A290